MSSALAPPPPDVPPGVPPAVSAAGRVSAGGLERLVGLLESAERALAGAVLLAGELSGSGVCEAVEGLPLELFVGLRVRIPQADVRMVVSAGETLRHLPVTAGLFERGALSWGQVRRVTMAARRLTVEQRGEVDARVEASVAEHGGIDAFDPDGLVDAVDDAAAEIRERDGRKPRPAAVDNYLAVQARVDGGITFHGEADALGGAAILSALDAASPRPAGAGQPTEPGQPARRGRQYLAGLVTVCSQWLGGGPGRPARPLFVAHIDCSRPDLYGLLELGVRGKTPRIPAATLDVLARDADFRAVLFDRSRPLATSVKLHAATLPTDVEIAVHARDLGCRFPGSRDPLAFTDVHHVFDHPAQRSHDPDKLVALSRRHHTIVHKHGWRIELDPPTAKVTIRRRNRTWTSLPRGTPLSRPPSRPPEPGNRAPPGMPF